jgi:hypothetical protein
VAVQGSVLQLIWHDVQVCSCFAVNPPFNHLSFVTC